jgi:exodeoxyribonuclease VIII
MARTEQNMNDFSIDLETLGTRCTAPILSIGVQQFDIDTGKLGATLYSEVDIDSAIRAGRVQADTLAWWVTQNKNAQRVFAHNDQKMHLATALAELTTWMRGKSMAPAVWGNGATFDIAILEYAYDHGAVGLKEPWHFMKVRDLRTLIDTAQRLADFDKSTVLKVGVSHNALDDATYQAKLASAAWAALRKTAPVAKKAAAKVAPPAPAADEDDL